MTDILGENDGSRSPSAMLNQSSGAALIGIRSSRYFPGAQSDLVSSAIRFARSRGG